MTTEPGDRAAPGAAAHPDGLAARGIRGRLAAVRALPRRARRGVPARAREARAASVVDGHSLLYRWPGTGRRGAERAHGPPGRRARPTSRAGRIRPFGAELVGTGEDARIWARGTLDDKGALGSILEAVEARLAAGFEPAADVYLSFSHDEETAGTGAPSAVELLRSRGVRPGLVLDEGGAVVEGVFPGVAGPDRRRRREREGHRRNRARRREEGRPRVHPGARRRHDPARARDHPARGAPVPRRRCRSRRSR